MPLLNPLFSLEGSEEWKQRLRRMIAGKALYLKPQDKTRLCPRTYNHSYISGTGGIYWGHNLEGLFPSYYGREGFYLGDSKVHER
jgi:hypothetical protein